MPIMAARPLCSSLSCVIKIVELNREAQGTGTGRELVYLEADGNIRVYCRIHLC